MNWHLVCVSPPKLNGLKYRAWTTKNVHNHIVYEPLEDKKWKQLHFNGPYV